MSGKPTIPAGTHARIRRLAKKGHGRRVIAEMVGHSLYTIRKALDPEFVERERERHRRAGPARYAARKDDPAYRDYQAERNKHPERLAQVRERMAELRARRKPEGAGI